jgi:hypothetical protein
MARTTGRSGFKMRSGNTSAFKMMGSSPMRNDEVFVGKSKGYSTERTIDPNSKFDRAYFQDLDNKQRANEYLNSEEYKSKVKAGIEKFGSKKAYEANVLETTADRGKEGGFGATDYGTSVEADVYKMRNRNKEISNMSKKDLLKARGKKTNLVNRLLANKKKLKSQVVGESVSDYFDTKGSGMGQQTLRSGDVSDIDKYSGVTE